MRKKILNIISFIVLFILFGISIYCIFDGTTASASEKIETLEKEKKTVYVDIKGAINNPGVYEMDYDSRIIDQTTPNMIQGISGIFERNPLISNGI